MNRKTGFFISAFSVILFAILSVIPANVQAQGKKSEPITWSAEARMTSAKEGVVTLTANIADGWHLYGMEMPDDGPQDTSVTFPATDGIALKGSVTASSKPVVKQDPMFGVEVNFWEKKVVLTQKFKLTGKDVKSIQCLVSYMGCNDQTCLPPKKQEFTINIAPLKK